MRVQSLASQKISLNDNPIKKSEPEVQLEAVLSQAAIAPKSTIDQDFPVAIDLDANFFNSQLVEGGVEDEEMLDIDLDKPLLLFN